MLALLAGTAGLMVAVVGSRALVALAPADVPRLSEAAVDSRVLAFTFGVSVICSLLFGLVSALYASRINLNDALKQGTARAVTGGRSSRLRGALVIAEIALSVMLLSGAGLLIKSFVALSNVALGFRPERVLLSMLFEVTPSDPATYVGVAVLLGLVVLSASYLPARRAAKLDPLVALRQE